MVIDVIHDWIGLIIQFGTLITMLWAAGKFLDRPKHGFIGMHQGIFVQNIPLVM